MFEQRVEFSEVAPGLQGVLEVALAKAAVQNRVRDEGGMEVHGTLGLSHRLFAT